jgi:hypothetical protein
MDCMLNVSGHELATGHRGAIALTFDDWFVEEWQAADSQIFAQLGLRATFFISDPGGHAACLASHPMPLRRTLRAAGIRLRSGTPSCAQAGAYHIVVATLGRPCGPWSDQGMSSVITPQTTTSRLPTF